MFTLFLLCRSIVKDMIQNTSHAFWDHLTIMFDFTVSSVKAVSENKRTGEEVLDTKDEVLPKKYKTYPLLVWFF